MSINYSIAWKDRKSIVFILLRALNIWLIRAVHALRKYFSQEQIRYKELIEMFRNAYPEALCKMLSRRYFSVLTAFFEALLQKAAGFAVFKVNLYYPLLKNYILYDAGKIYSPQHTTIYFRR